MGISGRLLQGWLGLAVALVGFCHSTSADEVALSDALDAEKTCAALAKADFLGLEDAPTQLMGAKVVEATSDVPTYCEVDGYVAPQVGVEVLLPLSNWNGKLITAGDYGWAGSFNEEACRAHLRRGYACVTTDTGHKGRGDDGLWAANNLAAQIDFTFRAIHVATLAGKAITHAYYGGEAQKAYFMSCSTGGYEGLVEAQRFPWDFDGIIAGAPDMDEADLTARQLWTDRALRDRTGKPVLDKLAVELLHRVALERCDRDGGLRDGLISDPLSCRVDPAELLCKLNETKGCLSAAQVTAAQHIYEGPPHSAGRNVGGALPGSELMWASKWGGLAGEGFAEYFDGFFKYMVYGISPTWSGATYDFEKDYRRLGLSLYNATNPDLRHFQAAGAKLLVYQGGNDVLERPGAIVDYYRMVERLIGSRKSTQEFFRLFVVPGMNHCWSGQGPYAIDYLSYLEAWVEHNHPPSQMIGAHVNDAYLAAQPLPASIESTLPQDADSELRTIISAGRLHYPLDPGIPVDFTRPIYPFPLHARYVKGDPKQASSFQPVGPAQKASRATGDQSP
jgi:hypothetical protein